jgi:hypothetical protein
MAPEAKGPERLPDNRPGQPLRPGSGRFAACAATLLAVWAAGCVEAGSASPVPSPAAITTQEQYLQGLMADVDVADSLAVFAYVFAGLPDLITVFPSENYYYVRFHAKGREFRGSLNFFASTVDDGSFGFVYEEVGAYEWPLYDGVQGRLEVTPAGPARLNRVADQEYALSFRGRTVRVRFHRLDQHPPRQARLREGEVFVANTLDESGTAFHLVFSGECASFVWLLDEEHGVREPLVEFSAGLRVGVRTRFAFYYDEPARRTILIGVHAEEERRNSWYDGPFDQLPDNEIKAGRVRLAEYLQRAPATAGTATDAYGIFLDDPESRVAITPYATYTRPSDLVRDIEEARGRSDGCALIRDRAHP